MKYMLMMNTPGGRKYRIDTWPEADFKAHIAFMIGFVKALAASRELVSAEGLAGPDQAKRVRAGEDGLPVIDGVFAETKDFLTGYWVVDVESPERAYQMAAQASAAPGPGGTPLNMPIEVRRILSAPPEDL